MQFAYCIPANQITKADAIQILGAVYFYLREQDICRTVADAKGNNLAQGDVLRLRSELFSQVYGKTSA